MTFHPETLEIVGFLVKYSEGELEFGNKYPNGHICSISDFGTLVETIVENLQDTKLSEEDQSSLKQLLGFTIYNPEFVRAYFDQ